MGIPAVPVEEVLWEEEACTEPVVALVDRLPVVLEVAARRQVGGHLVGQEAAASRTGVVVGKLAEAESWAFVPVEVAET